uniref:iron-containing alcohol dehydrogenase n=1 Tax=Nocardia brasiliensis TaxID=37326 RepID=UPI0024583250
MHAADFRVSTLLLDSPRTLMGERAAEVAPAVVRAAAGTGAPRVLLVAGNGFRHRAWAEPLLTALQGFALRTVVHAGLPTPESVARLTDEIRAHRTEVVVTVGGGSVMDAGKAAAAQSSSADRTPHAVVQACAAPADGARAPPLHALPEFGFNATTEPPFA